MLWRRPPLPRFTISLQAVSGNPRIDMMIRSSVQALWYAHRDTPPWSRVGRHSTTDAGHASTRLIPGRGATGQGRIFRGWSDGVLQALENIRLLGLADDLELDVRVRRVAVIGDLDLLLDGEVVETRAVVDADGKRKRELSFAIS